MSSKKQPEPIPLFQPVSKPVALRPSQIIGITLESGFLLFALLLLLQGVHAYRDLTTNVAINFLALLVEALPFMAIGSLAGGLIEVFVPSSLVERIFSRNKKRAVLLAGALGLLFPVCECAIVPVVRRLLGKGVPFSAAITFLLAGPIVNPIVAASTAIAYRYDWQIVALRLGCGYLIAVTVGLLLGLFFTRENGLAHQVQFLSNCHCGHDHGADEHSLSTRLRWALAHAGDDFLEVGKYLIIGCFLAAFTRTTVSMETFTTLMNSPGLAIVLMMLLAMVLNLCSEADAFIAASFQQLLPTTSQLAFMVLGPMLDLKLILMYFSIFRKRVISALTISVFSLVLLLMLGLQYLAGRIG
jgi:uncharacterized membrane protein YraQ (UPF0718 family)